MTVYLGNFGSVELQRQFGGEELTLTVETSGVDATKKRFSFKDLLHGQLLTGDKLEITTTSGSALGLVSGNTDKSIKKYIHVDAVDGIRLYDTFAKAVNGTQTDAETLVAPSSDLSVKVKVENEMRVIAQIESYELNTERETVDTTVLSDEFRNRISTLISGSGRIVCEWEYTGDDNKELANYMLELILRTKVGSNFSARFFLKTDGYNPSNVAARSNDFIFYDVQGCLTAVALQFAPGNIVKISADFVTTGEVQLRAVVEPPDKLLQQDGSSLFLEQDTSAKIGMPGATT